MGVGGGAKPAIQPPDEKYYSRGLTLASCLQKVQTLPCGVEKAVKRIPYRNMECPDSTRELLEGSFGKKLDQLRGFFKTVAQERKED
jgi:hypothetical protein